MKTELQKQGNALVVGIPEANLTDCGISKTINIIEPSQSPRTGWFDHYQARQDTDVWQNLPPDHDGEDWAW